jgi:hypothetical protein
MGLHHAHKRQLEEIKGEVLSLGALRQLKTDDEDGIRTAKFLISARNPADEARQMTVRSVLPTIIKSSDVIDRKGFTLLFDERSGAYVLEKVEQFDARETRKYTVEIRDVWYIPEQDMNFLREKTEDVLAHFEDTEFENYADQIGEYIYETLTQIELLQAEVSSSEVLKERVQAFVLNQQRLESAKKKFKELQDLLLEIPMKRSLTVTEQVKQSLKQIAKLLDVLSVGFKPDLSTTWWTILGICVFIAIFATSFYVIWIGKLNENPWGKKDVKAKGKPKEKAKADVGQKAA